MDEVQQADGPRRRFVESDEEVSRLNLSSETSAHSWQSNYDLDSVVDAPWRAKIFDDNDERL